jgi:hypothetical protein
VRVGNAGYMQLQLDIFGEVMDALHQARQGGLGANDTGWAIQREFLMHLAKSARADEGLWEVRSGREHFTHSKVMAWLAFDRAIRSAEMFKLPGPIEQWRAMQRTHPRRCVRARVRCDPWELRACLWLEGSRRQPAVAAGDRVSAAARIPASSLRSGDRTLPNWSKACCSATTA